MTIIYRGNTINVNSYLLDKQDCWQNLKGILETRIKIQDLLEREEEDLKNNRLTKELAKKYLEDITDLDYDLQMYWEFPEDPLYHTYHYYLAGCICPIEDNLERIPHPSRIVTKGCPYHDISLDKSE